MDLLSDFFSVRSIAFGCGVGGGAILTGYSSENKGVDATFGGIAGLITVSLTECLVDALHDLYQNTGQQGKRMLKQMCIGTLSGIIVASVVLLKKK